MHEASGEGKARSTAIAGVALRIAAVAIAYAAADRLIGLLSGPRPSFAPVYLQLVAVALVTGAGYALILLPLARRLRYRMPTRLIALFLPLYWIALASNLMEAYFDTTLPRTELIAGGVIFAIPFLLVCWLTAWLFPAHDEKAETESIGHALRQRSLSSWIWRTLSAGLLFAIVLQLFGMMYSPLISRYYHDPAFMAQTHTIAAPAYIAWPEEVVRGIVFVLVLLPVLAVFRGRSLRQILILAGYVALIDAVLESWLAMLAQTSWPLQFRLGEGLDLTSDAIARGVFVGALLALPVLSSVRAVTNEMRTSREASRSNKPIPTDDA